ncbi:hypothetical protein HDK77DRAFT_68997 [Phyllosticta capitalensis]|uniref:Uncharacterized protein n=1 Tax=Phyllosticta capitalensis TaxID=121624 RepID=A0ABR1YR73_9PEZI
MRASALMLSSALSLISLNCLPSLSSSSSVAFGRFRLPGSLFYGHGSLPVICPILQHRLPGPRRPSKINSTNSKINQTPPNSPPTCTQPIFHYSLGSNKQRPRLAKPPQPLHSSNPPTSPPTNKPIQRKNEHHQPLLLAPAPRPLLPTGPIHGAAGRRDSIQSRGHCAEPQLLF